MNKQELIASVDRALESLKDFQSATVHAVYRQMFKGGQRCMLVADEVGLGKTIVARGLIAKAIKSRLSAGKRTPLRVTYICSNQVIAQENLQKLNLFQSTAQMNKPVSRLIYLARNEAESPAGGKQPQSLLELNSLTPATSFEVQNSAGLREERAIIYGLLCQDRRLKNRCEGLQWLLRGSVEKMAGYRASLESMVHANFQNNLPARFVNRLKREILPVTEKLVYEHLRGQKERTLYEAVIEYSEMLDGRTEKSLHRGCLVLIHNLRRILIHCCLRYVNADLYILDEFQRFRHLIDLNNEEEEALIARKVLSKGTARILLLSATPFKAYTNHDDLERGEDHHKDFRSILEFLLGKDEARLAHYDKHRQALYGQLLSLRKGEIDLDPTNRRHVEALLRSVICRTERNSVADDPSIMIEDQWREPLKVTPGDIANFANTDQIARVLNRLGLRIEKPVEYCKSALFPLSFLDHYKFKEVLNDHKEDPEIKQCLKNTKNAWLSFGDLHHYRTIVGAVAEGKPSNARLTALVDKAIGTHGANLLWVPPSLPYYPLTGVFEGAANFTKTLVFSAWVMVPRMISTLLSYEVERRTIHEEGKRESNNEHDRQYFKADGKRHPVQQLRFSRKKRDLEVRLGSMSNFCLLYPSISLANATDLVANLQTKCSLEKLQLNLREHFRQAVKRANLQQFTVSGGDSSRWYWAAPLLLDRSQPDFHNSLNEFFWGNADPDPWKRSTYFRRAAENTSVKESHFLHLRECFQAPVDTGLGHVPEDLPDVMADLALGSPAVLALRSLRRLFPAQQESRAMVCAFDVADEFVTLFNKPESIAAVRLGSHLQSEASPPETSEVKGYWQAVARYCAQGCLQAVLDEYLHVLKGRQSDAEGVILQFCNSTNLDTISINVDDLSSFKAGKPKKMRCHYAVEFGSQRLETDKGGNRVSNLLQAFNSPFRPFVLATTSIGQEGLDFHSYCRRIVHWNLPSNPIDLEQREGRINRYKGLVIRQCLAARYRDVLGQANSLSLDVWDRLFAVADKVERQDAGKCQIVPYWHTKTDSIRIERIVPLYPFSTDQARLTRLLKTLAVYRLAFGQPRQAELVEHLLNREFSPEEMKLILENLMIDLSPLRHGQKTNRRAAGVSDC